MGANNFLATSAKYHHANLGSLLLGYSASYQEGQWDNPRQPVSSFFKPSVSERAASTQLSKLVVLQEILPCTPTTDLFRVVCPC